MRVLIADDSPDLARVLGYVLVGAGHETKTVTQNFGDLLHPEAWAGVDAAVVDLRLGDATVTGADIAEAVAGFRPTMRLVLLTGSERGNGEAFSRASRWACAVLRKPVTSTLLLAALEGPP